jgi:uncharacterized protein involved in outer membrane biogenesis
MKKVLLTLLILLLLVFGVGAWWLSRSLDSLVASAIRSYGPEITGVSVSLDGVKIVASEGTASLSGLRLGNPKGFNLPNSLVLGEISTRLDIASLTKDVVHIQEVVISRPLVTYEYSSNGSNLDQIQKNVQSYIDSHTSASEPAKNPGKQKKIIIDNLIVRDAHAEVSATALGGKALTVPLPDIHLKDIGKKSEGASPAEVASQVVGSITQGASKAASALNLGAIKDSVQSGASKAIDAVKGLFSK